MKTLHQKFSFKHCKQLSMRTLLCLAILGPLPAMAKDLDSQSHYVQLTQGKAHFLQAGEGEPILMLHGIPTHAGLWSKLLPDLARIGNAVALDFLGYGKSDKPLNSKYDFKSQYQFLSEFIASQNYQDLTLVVTDLGSIIGIHYAIQHPERIKRLVILEGAYMPAQEWIQSITPFQQMMFQQMENPFMAQIALVGMNPVPLFMSMFTKRPLSSQEILSYSSYFENPTIRQKVLLEGIGPATIAKEIKSQIKGGLGEIMDQNAKGLQQSLIPILLLKADPGLLIQKSQLDYAKQHFKSLTVESIGEGIHYLSEDQPNRISNAITLWVSKERVRLKFNL